MPPDYKTEADLKAAGNCHVEIPAVLRHLDAYAAGERVAQVGKVTVILLVQ